MNDKYNLTIEQSISLAKRQIVDNIYRSARLEGVAVTFPETKEIFEGRNIGRLRVDEIQIINNLKHAWRFLLNSVDFDDDFKYLCSVNALVRK